MEKEMLLGKQDFRAALSTQRKSEIMIVAPVFARTHTISSNTFFNCVWHVSLSSFYRDEKQGSKCYLSNFQLLSRLTRKHKSEPKAYILATTTCCPQQSAHFCPFPG